MRQMRNKTTGEICRVEQESIQVRDSSGEWTAGVLYMEGGAFYAEVRETFDREYEPLVCNRCGGLKKQELERWVGLSGVGWCCATGKEIHDGVPDS